MSRQYFADVLTEPLLVDYTTITATAATLLIPLSCCPIAAYEPRAGKVYELIVGGTCTTGASGTLIINARVGTSATPASNTTVATSNTQTVVPSITTAGFILRSYLVYRSIGLPGANSTVVCYGFWTSSGAAATAASETSVNWGSTATASVDASIAQNFEIDVTFSVAPSVIPRFHTWRSLN